MQTLQIPGEGGRLEEWTVRDLKSALAELPDDALVVCSSDAEGNQFHPLMQVWIGAHYRGERYGGEVIEGRPRKTDKPSIVLVPMD